MPVQLPPVDPPRLTSKQHIKGMIRRLAWRIVVAMREEPTGGQETTTYGNTRTPTSNEQKGA